MSALEAGGVSSYIHINGRLLSGCNWLARVTIVQEHRLREAEHRFPLFFLPEARLTN